MLAAGTTLGPYRILAPLGTGGMGEVYRARDSRLRRDVAVKVIPATLARDPENLKRFELEARAAGALSHPNVCAVLDTGSHDGAPFVVMELLEGESLRQRLAAGPIAAHKAVGYAAQAAHGLAAAHAKGIVHRDLKPENLFVTRDGRVKVVDFGIAKLTRPELLAGAGETPPSLARTESGALVGTAGYMAPEQVRGEAADARSDLFALGAILYELLTGKRAFRGATQVETLNAILHGEPPPLAASGREIPASAEAIVRRCLEKSPEERFQSARDLAFDLEALRGGVAAPARAPAARRAAAVWRWALGVMALLAAVAAVAAVALLGPRLAGVGSGVKRLSITMPDTLRVGGFGLIPGGRGIWVSAVPRGAQHLPWRFYVRRFDGLEFKPLRGSEGAWWLAPSPDGRWCAMAVPVAPGAGARRLVRVSLEGDEPPVPIADWPGGASGWLLWLPDGFLISSRDGRRYYRIPLDGGLPRMLAIPSPDTARLGFYSSRLLGRLASFSASTRKAGVFQYDQYLLDPGTGRMSRVVTDAGPLALLDRGPLVFARRDKLFAAPFDRRRMEVTGPEVALLDGLRAYSTHGHAGFDMLPDGTLLYEPGGVVGTRRRLGVAGPFGRVEPWSLEPVPFTGEVRLSPDGRRVAAAVSSPRGMDEIWVLDVGSQALDHRILSAAADCRNTVWSPDGRWIAYSQFGSEPVSGIYVTLAGGSGPARRVLASDSAWPTGWDARNGLLYFIALGADDTYDGLALPLGPEADSIGPPRPLLAGPAQVWDMAPSPDGGLLAYDSDESGRYQTHVARLGPGPTVRAPLRVADSESWSPRWSHDGRRLYVQVSSPSGSVLVFVEVTTTPRLAVSRPQRVLDAERISWDHAVLPDGRLLAVLRGEEEPDDIRELAVALGFGDEIRRKLRRAP